MTSAGQSSYCWTPRGQGRVKILVYHLYSFFLKAFSVSKTVLLLRHRSEGVKTTAETVQQALVDAKNAQTSAEKAIAKAKADIGDTEARLAQVTNPNIQLSLQ